jgi:hypothetical protein
MSMDGGDSEAVEGSGRWSLVSNSSFDNEVPSTRPASEEACSKVSAASAQPGSELRGDLAGLVDPKSHSADGHLAL